MHKNNLPLLEARMKKSLPGWQAQSKMSPIKTNRYLEYPENAKMAGVLAVLYPDKNDHLKIIFIERSRQENDKHSGQISFPGGQQEEEDIDLKMTAVRETFEEIGIPDAELNVIGKLTPLYVYVSNFYVEPYVAYINNAPEYVIQKSEVGSVIEADISYLLSDKSQHEKDFKIRNNIFRNMPHYKIGSHILWGATAMITAELLCIMEEI